MKFNVVLKRSRQQSDYGSLSNGATQHRQPCYNTVDIEDFDKCLRDAYSGERTGVKQSLRPKAVPTNFTDAPKLSGTRSWYPFAFDFARGSNPREPTKADCAEETVARRIATCPSAS